MSFEILRSALKHGHSVADILHAVRNPVAIFGEDDSVQMIIGADRTGALLEVGLVLSNDQVRIVHCMAARQKYLDRM